MSHTDAFLVLPDAPTIPGLTFHLFQGEADIPVLTAVREAVRVVDGNIWLPGPDTVSNPACDPAQDCLLVEVNGIGIGYSWLDWWEEVDGTRLYLLPGWIVPEWRRKGIGRALLHWQEQRLRLIAQTHPATGPFIFGANADESQPASRALLLSEGYSVAFTFVHMVCQLPDTPISLAPLPDGLVLRPAEAEHLQAIYAANEEAFQDSRAGHIRESYASFFQDLHWPEVDTSLWFIAWDGDEIAGLVINEIAGARGHTPWVAVRSPWRRCGLGKALMTRTIRRFQEQGVKQAGISTIAENPGRSVHLYESVGYRVVERQPRYRKPMFAGNL
jgi:mycothiol synthase